MSPSPCTLATRRHGALPVKGVVRDAAWLAALLAAGLMLGGCSTVPAEDAVVLSPAERDVAEPGPPMSQETLYKLLVAEFAGRYGDVPLALRNYLAVAKESGDPRAAERAVRIAMFARDVEGGLQAAELWAELAPENHEAKQVHAVLLLRAGALDEAVEVLREVVTAVEGDSPGEGLRLVSDVLSRERDRASAVRVMEKLVAERPDDPRADFAFGYLLARVEEFDRAERAFERVLAAEPDDEHATVLLSRIHQQRGDLPQALAVLERALAARPQASIVRLTYARLLVEVQRVDEARAHFEHLLGEDEDNEDVRYALALLLLQTQVLDRAEEEFRVLTQSIERRDAAWYYLGQIAEARRDHDAALAAYSRVERGDNWLNAQFRAALLLSGAGRVDEARARLHALRGRNVREAVRLYRTEADILASHSRFEEAMQVLSAALREFPENTDLLYSRAMLAVGQDDLALAERDLSAIIERDPDNATALNALGYTLADRTDRIEEAYRLVKRAYDLQPDDHYIMDSMGWVMYRMGRHQEALRFLRRALEISWDPEIAAHLGEVLWVTGNKEEARELWDSALKITPHDKHLLDVRKRFGL